MAASSSVDDTVRQLEDLERTFNALFYVLPPPPYSHLKAKFAQLPEALALLPQAEGALIRLWTDKIAVLKEKLDDLSYLEEKPASPRPQPKIPLPSIYRPYGGRQPNIAPPMSSTAKPLIDFSDPPPAEVIKKPFIYSPPPQGQNRQDVNDNYLQSQPQVSLQEPLIVDPPPIAARIATPPVPMSDQDQEIAQKNEIGRRLALIPLFKDLHTAETKILSSLKLKPLPRMDIENRLEFIELALTLKEFSEKEKFKWDAKLIYMKNKFTYLVRSEEEEEAQREKTKVAMKTPSPPASIAVSPFSSVGKYLSQVEPESPQLYKPTPATADTGNASSQQQTPQQQQQREAKVATPQPPSLPSEEARLEAQLTQLWSSIVTDLVSRPPPIASIEAQIFTLLEKVNTIPEEYSSLIEKWQETLPCLIVNCENVTWLVNQMKKERPVPVAVPVAVVEPVVLPAPGPVPVPEKSEPVTVSHAPVTASTGKPFVYENRTQARTHLLFLVLRVQSLFEVHPLSRDAIETTLAQLNEDIAALPPSQGQLIEELNGWALGLMEQYIHLYPEMPQQEERKKDVVAQVSVPKVHPAPAAPAPLATAKASPVAPSKSAKRPAHEQDLHTLVTLLEVLFHDSSSKMKVIEVTLGKLYEAIERLPPGEKELSETYSEKAAIWMARYLELMKQ